MADDIRVAPSSEPSIPADPWKAAFAEWWHSSGFRKSFSVEEVFKAGWDAAPIERLGRAEDRMAELEGALREAQQAYDDAATLIAGGDIFLGLKKLDGAFAALAAPSGVNTKEKV